MLRKGNGSFPPTRRWVDLLNFYVYKWTYPLGENNRTFRQLALLKCSDIGSTMSLIAEKEWDNTLINWAIQYAMVRYSSWLISIIIFYVFTYIKGLIPLDRKSVLKLRLFIVSPTFFACWKLGYAPIKKRFLFLKIVVK